ncbi:LysR family transcriptional regulator [Facilibium subflavum]|uniref:LysR family transcriptional regulator n=1 Tax=Facilibium subflavum TaxID=2219058 RepID=UPI000E652198|nr:LysR family transcriptional regulator [Facilibium subflavum]
MLALSPQLEAFMAVASTGSVHAAAEVLHLTQTAVTQRIKMLEQKLGISLFIRSRKGMKLTAEGEILLRYCDNMQKLEKNYLQMLSNEDEHHIINLTILSSSTMMKTRILYPVAKIAKKYPQLRIHFQISDVDSRHTELKAGRADLAVVQNQFISKEMCTKALQPEHYHLLVPKAWSKKAIEKIIVNENIIDFDPSDEITFNFLRKYDLFEMAKKDRHFANSPEALAELVALALGYTVVTKQFYQQYCDHEKTSLIKQAWYYDHDLSLCWYNRGALPVYFQEIIDAIN